MDKRSGVSQRLPISVMENVLSNAERRAVVAATIAVPRVTDLYAALPSMTGKFELEYEGELKGADTVARELVRGAVASVAEGYLTHLDPRQVIEWFDLGGSLQLGDTISAADSCCARSEVQGLVALAHSAGVAKDASAPVLAAGIDFVLEGLYATKTISRSEERGYHAAERAAQTGARGDRAKEEAPMPTAGGKKKYYN